jgi:pilus assembly protein Flp/PilA
MLRLLASLTRLMSDQLFAWFNSNAGGFGQDSVQMRGYAEGMKELVAAFTRGDTAATAVEYALIAFAIAVAVVAGVQGVGTNVSALYASVQAAVK